MDCTNSAVICRNCYAPGATRPVPIGMDEDSNLILSRYKFCSLECQRGYVLYNLQFRNPNCVSELALFVISEYKTTLAQMVQSQPRDPESVRVCCYSETQTEWRCRNCSRGPDVGESKEAFKFSLFDVLRIKTEGSLPKEILPTQALNFCGSHCALTYLHYNWSQFPWVVDVFLLYFKKKFPSLDRPQVLQNPDYLSVFCGHPGISFEDYHSQEKIMLVQNGPFSQVCMNRYTMTQVIYNVRWETDENGVEQCVISDITQTSETDGPGQGEPHPGNGAVEKSVPKTAEQDASHVTQRKTHSVPVVHTVQRTLYRPSETQHLPVFFNTPRNSNQVLDKDQWQTQFIGRSVGNGRSRTDLDRVDNLEPCPTDSGSTTREPERACSAVASVQVIDKDGYEPEVPEEGIREAQFLGFEVDVENQD